MKLLEDFDILMLQETFLSTDECSLLDTFDSRFLCAYVPATRNPEVFVGRSSGGLAIFWRKNIGSNLNFTPVFFLIGLWA